MPLFNDSSSKRISPASHLLAPSTGPLAAEKYSTIRLPATTRVLTGALSETAIPRVPVVIKGGMKKTLLFPPRAPKTRHPVASWLSMSLLFLVLMLTLFMGTPLGREVGLNPNLSLFSNSLFSNHDNNTGNLIAQATAVYFQNHDGYDPYATYGQTMTNGSVSRPWPYGQCTYWANDRYQQLTGYWVPWNGNADQWVAGAKLAHWGYSQTPHLPSIIVLMPGTQSASIYGHVAVVESINPDGSVHTSNMNWGYRGSTHVEYVDFTPGPGVYFVWHL